MIVLNERDFAELAIRENDIGENPYQTISILSKYFCHGLGHKRKQIEKDLMAFIESTYPIWRKKKDFWEEIIEKLAKKAKAETLYEIEGVWITKNELAVIEQIGDKVIERLAFTSLCLAKLAMRRNPNANGWVCNDAKEIFSLARISCESGERYVKIAKLRDLGLAEFSHKNEVLSYRLTFIERDDYSDGVLFIHDFRELGYEYMKYKGHNFIRCAECGILTRGNKAGTRIYCKKCSGEKPGSGYIARRTRTFFCENCGVEVTTNSHNTKSVLCSTCRDESEKKRKREWRLANMVKASEF